MTGCILWPGAPDDLLGSSSALVHACHTYVWCALHKCLGPTGPNSFYNAFYIKHLKLINIVK